MAPKQQSVKRNSPLILRLRLGNTNRGQPRKESTITSILTEKDVKKLMKKYKISSFSALAAGDAPANNPPPEHIAVYQHTLSDGLFFPLSTFISSTLGKLGVPIVQLPPNAIRMLVGFELLCFYHDIPCNPHDFDQLFRVVKARDQIYFKSKSLRIYYNAPEYNKGWENKFFFLKYDMGMYPKSPKNLEKYQVDSEYPDVHAKFQVSRVMDLSKGWDNSLVRDYLKLARESKFTKYTWPSENDRLHALSEWKKAFERRSISREDYEKIGDEPTIRPVGECVGQVDSQEEIPMEGEEDLLEESDFLLPDFLRFRKRRISDAVVETSAEPAHTKAKIDACSNSSNHDVEGHNAELNGVSGQILSGRLARTPITPLDRNCFTQNMPAVEENPPKDRTSFPADMGKMTEMFFSSVMEREKKLIMEREEKLAQSNEALDAKIAECQAWEEKFIVSQKEHERILSNQAKEHQEKLSECLNQHALALSKQKEYKKLLEENNEKLKMCMNEHVLSSSKQKEYEMLLEHQRSESRILKENLAGLKEGLDARTAECEVWKKEFYMLQQVYEDKLTTQEEEYNQNLKQCVHENIVALKKEQDYEKLLEGQRSDLTILKEQKEAAETSLNEVKVWVNTIFTRYEDKVKTLQRN